MGLPDKPSENIAIQHKELQIPERLSSIDLQESNTPEHRARAHTPPSQSKPAMGQKKSFTNLDRFDFDGINNLMQLRTTIADCITSSNQNNERLENYTFEINNKVNEIKILSDLIEKLINQQNADKLEYGHFKENFYQLQLTFNEKESKFEILTNFLISIDNSFTTLDSAFYYNLPKIIVNYLKGNISSLGFKVPDNLENPRPGNAKLPTSTDQFENTNNTTLLNEFGSMLDIGGSKRMTLGDNLDNIKENHKLEL